MSLSANLKEQQLESKADDYMSSVQAVCKVCLLLGGPPKVRGKMKRKNNKK